MPPRVVIRLAGLGSVVPVPSEPAAAVANLWADRAPVFLGPCASSLLGSWEQAVDGVCGDGPGRSPAEQIALVRFLREQVRSRTLFTFNALWREPQGGREYPFVLPGYGGSITVSQKAYRAAGRRGPLLLLSAMRRDVRGLLQAPAGYRLITGDFRSCHAHLAHALTGDEVLARDLAQDFHQVTGDRILDINAWPDRRFRRKVGKKINNAMIFGLSPIGLQGLIEDSTGVAVTAACAEQHWNQWWGRYPKLDGLRRRVQAEVARAQLFTMPLDIYSPSGRKSTFQRAEVCDGAVKGRQRSPRDPRTVWRSVFSAVFRALEGDLLQRTVAHFVRSATPHGGAPALPLYDGLLVVAPRGGEAPVVAALRAAAQTAADEMGVPDLTMDTHHHPREQPHMVGPGGRAQRGRRGP